MEEKYYRPSGKIGLMSFIWLALGIMLIAPLLATAYAYAIWYMPFAYINMIFTMVFGASVGFWHRWVVRNGRIRNVAIDVIFLTLLLAMAYYLHWAVWVDLALNAGEVIGNQRLGIAISNVSPEEVLGLAVMPSELLKIIGMINENGAWSLKGKVVSGWFLTAFWVLELIVIIAATYTIGGLFSKKPYSEKHKKWFKEHVIEHVGGLEVEREDWFKSELERGRDAFADLHIVEEGGVGRFHQLKIFECEGENCGYLSMERIVKSLNKKGEETIDLKKSIFDQMRVSTEQILKLKNLPTSCDEVEAGEVDEEA